jgi:threonine dehydratase
MRVPVFVGRARKSRILAAVFLGTSERPAAALGLLLEPSGAAGLAAIRCHEIPGHRLATILTGSNIHPAILAELIDSPR